MPLFMDVHERLPQGATAKDVAQAHSADVQTQDQYGVNYLKYCAISDPASRPRLCRMVA